jgi:hypothetical protein
MYLKIFQLEFTFDVMLFATKRKCDPGLHICCDWNTLSRPKHCYPPWVEKANILTPNNEILRHVKSKIIFLPLFTATRHWILTWAKWIQNTTWFWKTHFKISGLHIRPPAENLETTFILNKTFVFRVVTPYNLLDDHQSRIHAWHIVSSLKDW